MSRPPTGGLRPHIDGHDAPHGPRLDDGRSTPYARLIVDLIVNSSISHSLLLILPIITALLMRAARCPGWPIVGGVFAGILIGATVFGRMAPDAYEKLFIGGEEIRQERDEILSRHQAEERIALEVVLDATQRDEMRIRHLEERLEINQRLHDERWSHQRPLRSYGTTLVILVFVVGGLLTLPRPPSPVVGGGAASIGAWAALLPGGVVAASMLAWWTDLLPSALMAGACVAVGPWVLTDADREAADHAEQDGAYRLQRAGRVASSLAVVAAVTAMVIMWASTRPTALVWVAPILALPISWLVSGRALSDVARQRLLLILQIAVIPGCTTVAMLQVDVLLHASLWPILVLGLASGDGRWTGALLGALLPGGRRSWRTMRLVLGAMACGPTQVALVAIGAVTGLLTPTITFALILGAVIMETTGGARRRMNTRFEEVEEAIDNATEEAQASAND